MKIYRQEVRRHFLVYAQYCSYNGGNTIFLFVLYYKQPIFEDYEGQVDFRPMGPFDIWYVIYPTSVNHSIFFKSRRSLLHTLPTRKIFRLI